MHLYRYQTRLDAYFIKKANLISKSFILLFALGFQ